MPNQFDEQDSLDRAVTRTGGESRPDWLRPKSADDTDASLGEQVTGAESRSSLSDLADLGDDEDEPQEIVDLESRYEVLNVLGSGGMGEVVRAMDRRLKREVAIKRMRAELGASRQAMRRFLTEAVSVAALNHFNVVQIYDYGRTTDGPFLVMELVEGSTLAERLQDGPLPLEDAVEMACQLCNGLQAAHDRGIVHRDIKPANILLTGNGTPKLTDFGLAKEAGDTGHTRAGAVLGTLDYMSPEQKSDSTRADARSDQWSLAATFYQMVTGEVPRVIDTDAIPEAVRDVVRRALKTRPGTRFESVREFSKALQDAVEQSEEPALHRSSLQEGQCAECGSVNDMARQFCRGCGASLDETCPECGAGEKVWERFCGKCGTDIPAVLEAQIESARELPGEVQSLRSDFRHAEALEKLAPLLALRHPALKEYREWAEQAQGQVSSELSELESQREKLLQAAREQLEIGKFAQAKQCLTSVAEPLKNEECHHLKERITQSAAEARRLAAEIREATRSRNYTGLDKKLKRFLELRPQDQKARALLQKVQQRISRDHSAGSTASVTTGNVGPQTVRTVPEPFDSSCSPRTAEEACAAQKHWADYLGRDVVETNSMGMHLTLIPPGDFLRGSLDSDRESVDCEKPRHRVRITKPFQLQTTTVTQAQWKAVMGTEPWKGENFVREGGDFPATYISWESAQEFCRKLSQKEGVTYRLPTEAEWEYACRAGTTTRYHFGDDAERLGEYGWFWDNAGDIGEKYAHEVGRKKPNAWGLFDMHGNVWEWCQDRYDEDYYRQFASQTAVDPQGPSDGSGRSLRGGSWFHDAGNSRCSYRIRNGAGSRSSSAGFRLARTE